MRPKTAFVERLLFLAGETADGRGLELSKYITFYPRLCGPDSVFVAPPIQVHNRITIRLIVD